MWLFGIEAWEQGYNLYTGKTQLIHYVTMNMY